MFPDTNAKGEGEDPQWLYQVAFVATDLFPLARSGDQITLDLWDPYLSPA